MSDKKTKHMQTAIHMSSEWMYGTRGRRSLENIELVTRVSMLVVPNVTLAGAADISNQNVIHDITTKSAEGR